MLKQSAGNLLEADVEALVNTVNTQGVMGKGIALQFKRAFPENFTAYEREAKAGRIEVGRVFVHQEAALRPKFIINFPTKQHWRNPSRLEWIATGLDSLVAEVKRLGIRSLAIPPLGCGNGGLEWADVWPLIQQAVARMGEVSAVVFPPNGTPLPAAMPTATPRPTMTRGRAALVDLMDSYVRTGMSSTLTLLEVQKLMYFAQQAGEPLKLAFVEHHYGPYADNLRHVLNHVEGHFVSGYGDGRNAPTTQLELLDGAVEEARRLLEKEPETVAHLERVRRLIEGFETPFGMELLATVHWVATAREPRARTASEATAAIHDWNPRKARVMRPSHIAAALERLGEQGWLGASNPAARE